MEENDREEFELSVPFVAVISNGGPYDDEAFASGFICGMIWGDLGIGDAYSRFVPNSLLSQVDLIAMRHGYSVILTDSEDDWTLVDFLKNSEDGAGIEDL